MLFELSWFEYIQLLDWSFLLWWHNDYSNKANSLCRISEQGYCFWAFVLYIVIKDDNNLFSVSDYYKMKEIKWRSLALNAKTRVQHNRSQSAFNLNHTWRWLWSTHAGYKIRKPLSCEFRPFPTYKSIHSKNLLINCSYHKLKWKFRIPHFHLMESTVCLEDRIPLLEGHFNDIICLSRSTPSLSSYHVTHMFSSSLESSHPVIKIFSLTIYLCKGIWEQYTEWACYIILHFLLIF